MHACGLHLAVVGDEVCLAGSKHGVEVVEAGKYGCLDHSVNPEVVLCNVRTGHDCIASLLQTRHSKLACKLL